MALLGLGASGRGVWHMPGPPQPPPPSQAPKPSPLPTLCELAVAEHTVLQPLRRDGSHFRDVLNFLRDGTLAYPPPSHFWQQGEGKAEPDWRYLLALRAEVRCLVMLPAVCSLQSLHACLRGGGDARPGCKVQASYMLACRACRLSFMG